MKTIKIIDLLNKIANGEEVPKKIKYEENYYELKEKYNEYWEQFEYGYKTHTGGYLNIWRKDVLNDEVEILDEPKDNFTGWKMYQDGKVICSMDCSVDETKDNSIERLDIEEDAINRNERFIRKEDNKFVNLSVADYELAKKSMN